MNRAAKSPALSMVLALACCLAAGCADVKHARTTEPVTPAAPAASIPVAGTPTTTGPTVEVPPAGVAAADPYGTPAPSPVTQAAHPAQPAPAVQASVSSAPAKAPSINPVTTPKPSPKPAAAAAVATVPVPKAVPKVAPAPIAPPTTAATLDFKSLELRLRQTKAIGVLTKLSLKNQIDDLLAGFRAYHRRQGTATLADLRRNYDMLVLKVLSLLQDSDPSLARDIVKSRSAIWNILEDSRKFTESNLMAGATP